MPAPVVVYVAGAVVFVGAAFAFKEFVYTPHIAPKVEVWKESLRQQREARRRQPVAVPVRHASDSDDDDEPLIRGRRADSRGSDDFGGMGMSVELRDLVASEQSEWQSSSGESTLRHRKVRSRTVLDESNVFLPYDPISPTSPTSVVSSVANSPMSATGRSLHEMTQLSSSPVIHSPMPRTPINPSRLHTSITADAFLPNRASLSNSGPAGARRVVSPAETDISVSTVRSVSSASSFTPVVIGPPSRSSSAHWGLDFARSPTLDSLPPSRGPSTNALGLASQRVVSPVSASSPFTNVDTHPLSPSFGFNRSPSPVLLSPPQSTLHLGGDSDIAILSPSLRSAMFSPSMSSFDGHFEIDSSFDGSDDGSDGSWSNVGKRTHSP